MNNQKMLFGDDVEQSSLISNYNDIPGLLFMAKFVSSTEQIAILNEIDGRQWITDLKRRVQHYGYRYDYRARRVDPSMFVGKLPDFAKKLATRLYEKSLVPKIPDQMIINEYLPGQGISAHVDCEPCFESHIVTISLGWAYEMDLIALNDDRHVSMLLPIGSALVFTGDARRLWKHQIRARKSDNGVPRNRRVSLTFRNVILNSPHTSKGA